MGRKSTWTAEHHAEWVALRGTATFQSLEAVQRKGVARIDKTDVRPLMESSPRLAPHSTLGAVRRELREAAGRVDGPDRSAAILAILRATPESEPMTHVAAIRLARTILGETNVDLERVAREAGKPVEELSMIQRMAAITTGNDVFMRPPKTRHRPGEFFVLLRDLHEELLGGSEAARSVDESAADGSDEHAPPRDRRENDAHALRDILQRHYRTELELKRFSQALLDAHEAIERLHMHVELTTEDERFFGFNVTRDFQARFERYPAAVAIGDAPRAALGRCIPELRELIWLPPETPDLDDAVDTLIEDGMLEIRDPTRPSGYRAASFQRVPDDHEYIRRLEEDGLDPNTYRLLNVDVPDRGELVHYRSTLRMLLSRTRRRCAWLADGPTYIDKILVDLSGFEDAASSEHASVNFFLPGTDVASDPRCFERVVRGWVMRHHGFVIHW